MKRSHLNFLVDALAFAAFVFLVATGVILEFLLPAGSGHWVTLWGLDRHGWGNIHFWVAVFFLAALAIHVYLHWRWILSVVRGRPREGSGVRVGLGVLGMFALIAIAFAPLLSPVEREGGERSAAAPRWGLSAESEAILGSTTIGDVVETTGVTLDYLRSELSLADDVSPDDRLGVIAREHGFSVADVREVVERGIRAEPFTLEATEGARGAEAVAAPVDLPATAPAIAPEEQPLAEDHSEDHTDRPAGLTEIRGAMTLSEIVRLGVPREVLYQELGLPASVPTSERLGRLGRVYGFTMTQVRDLVESYR